MFTLDSVVPWGRSFDEYRLMFALTEPDLAARVLGCADGPASFNAELTARGGQVVSCDPLYQFSAAQIRARIADTTEAVLAQTRRNAHEFVWDPITSVEELGRVRRAAMDAFLEDYGNRRGPGRYVAAALPDLPFADASFDLAICSHYLFLYSAHVNQAAHLAGMLELCRVAQEVRVFPVLALGGERSPFVDPIADDLANRGFEVSVVPVDYEFQRGGFEMLRVTGEGKTA